VNSRMKGNQGLSKLEISVSVIENGMDSVLNKKLYKVVWGIIVTIHYRQRNRKQFCPPAATKEI
jgi:hypothetical protein